MEQQPRAPAGAGHPDRRRSLGGVGGLLLRGQGSRGSQQGAASPTGAQGSSSGAGGPGEERSAASHGSSGSGDLQHAPPQGSEPSHSSARSARRAAARRALARHPARGAGGGVDHQDEDEDYDDSGVEQGEGGDARAETGRELLARMQERGLADLQRQLEHLRRATAQHHAAVGRLEGAGGQEAAGSAGPSAVSPAAAVLAGRRGGPGGAGGSLAARLRRRTGEVENAVTRTPADEDDDAEVHPHVTCDGCGAGPPGCRRTGRVMKCADCEDFDFCARCYRDRERLGHPRGHRFQVRQAGGLLQFLESAMLEEALRRSAEGNAAARAAEEAAAAEARAAEALAKCARVPWSRGPKGGDEGECALCLEEYKEGEEVLKLGECGHLFHEECIGPWFHKAPTCPLCQQQV
ncbi:unnamed protein product [Prorocentrum cordatum]|uniref:RING-type domain-containing protein n=1 Tax=Prorocentrum cordatum TaxID=2364126 RepID=A0ABN9UBD8_9DINO|nr:unnamed protein product [Polarella glacialis]